MIAESHSQLNEQLREFAPGVASITRLQDGNTQRTTGFRGVKERDKKKPVTDRKPGQGESGKTFDRAGLADRRESHSPLNQVLNIERKATQNYLRSSNQMLERYQGQDFDMGYLGFQIGSHTWTIAELNALKNVGDDKFQKLVRETSTKLENHLQKAKELSKKYEDQERPALGTREKTRSKTNR